VVDEPAGPGAGELKRDRVAVLAVVDEGDELGVPFTDGVALQQHQPRCPAALAGGNTRGVRSELATEGVGRRVDLSRMAVDVGELAGEEAVRSALAGGDGGR
jgi:hypothetical protein